LSNPKNPVKKAFINSNRTFNEIGIKKFSNKKHVKNIRIAALKDKLP
jgi:hypothetical protein